MPRFEKAIPSAASLKLSRTMFRRASAPHAQWDEKLDARLAQALMSVQAVKAVELGAGVAAATSYGSEVQDEIGYDSAAHKFTRAK